MAPCARCGSLGRWRDNPALVPERAGQREPQAFNLYTKEFVDALSHPRNLCPERQGAMIEVEPAALSAPWMDVSLAAIAEFVAQRSGLTTPAWAQAPGRFLAQPRLWGARPHTRAHMFGETPGPFRRRNDRA
ncbi:hypothetical protein Tchar_02557 [Tepidimonas charontis]|uniref:Uncharacterized protein n=1 Tax=Tepidimonas charontis TaxID=2267262 RepID=A0A554X1F7_9BURK|nr:hypothetical protein Tchar_02557 [Tepidimonas charontis]